MARLPWRQGTKQAHRVLNCLSLVENLLQDEICTNDLAYYFATCPSNLYNTISAGFIGFETSRIFLAHRPVRSSFGVFSTRLSIAHSASMSKAAAKVTVADHQCWHGPPATPLSRLALELHRPGNKALAISSHSAPIDLRSIAACCRLLSEAALRHEQQRRRGPGVLPVNPRRD